ncbi:MAG: AmmeMemoRadiSam system protein B, partial [Lentisphaeria bacterium]|nr:AmmeMemoRadiSam system protein B [Lentisphaeria bacterium]
MRAAVEVRLPCVAGLFYPDSPERLAAEVSRWLVSGESRFAERVRALVVPHAGYAYSGATAGRGYGLLAEGRDVVR